MNTFNKLGLKDDVQIIVGPSATHFKANKALLLRHSDYFQALLMPMDNNQEDQADNNSGSNSSTNEEQPQGESVIGISHVSAEAFSKLLQFIYNGTLDIDITSVYGVLLASKLLRIPAAQEICEQFLLKTTMQPKIDNSRLIPTPMDLLQFHSKLPLYPHFYERSIGQPYSNEPIASSSSAGMTQPLYPLSMPLSVLNFNSLFTSYQRNYFADNFPLVPYPSVPIPIPAQQPRQRDEIENTTEHLKTTTNTSSKTTDQEQPGTSSPNSKRKKLFKKRMLDNYVATVSRERIEKPTGLTGSSIDIACCDGPVRFERVLNQYYYMPEQVAAKVIEAAKLDELTGSEGTFCCVYCSQVFKSKYCYLKHKRRHLNPALHQNADLDDRNNRETATCSSSEAKPLDLNVQYFPCKTCGCKFPSYYFVHKHRKVCHEKETEMSFNENDRESVECE